jgi:uncharacterized protein YndB with AHSA1/START domain
VIEKRIVIHAKPETVYKALTESASLGRWLADGADSNPVEGGSLSIYRGAGETLDGARAVYVQLVPNRLVKIRWVEKMKPGETRAVSGDHECTFSIDENPEGVVVTMGDDESPPPSDQERLKREQGWDETLVALKSLCEGPDAPRVPEAPAAAMPAARPAAKTARPTSKKPAKKKVKSAKKPARRKAAKKGAKRSAKKAKTSGRNAAKRGARRPAKKAKRKAKGKAKKAPAKKKGARAKKAVRRGKK